MCPARLFFGVYIVYHRRCGSVIRKRGRDDHISKTVDVEKLEGVLREVDLR